MTAHEFRQKLFCSKPQIFVEIHRTWRTVLDPLGIILCCFVSFYQSSISVIAFSFQRTLSVFVSLTSSLDHATDVRLDAVTNEACINWDNQSNLDCLRTDCNFELETLYWKIIGSIIAHFGSVVHANIIRNR